MTRDKLNKLRHYQTKSRIVELSEEERLEYGDLLREYVIEKNTKGLKYLSRKSGDEIDQEYWT